MAHWRILTRHHIAHLNPTLTAGAAVAGYPFGSIRTLNPQERGRVASASTNLQIDWDRGASAAHNAIDALLLVASPLIATSAFEVYSDTVSDFATPTKFIDDGSNALDSIVPKMCLFTTNGASTELASTTERYMRLAIIAAGDDTYDFGVISMGKQYALGTEMMDGNDSGEPAAGYSANRIITRTFQRVSYTIADAVMADWRRCHIMDTTNASLDGWGGGAGDPRYPLALAKFSSETAVTSTEVYYGSMNISRRDWSASLAELTISARIPEVGPIRT